MLRRSTTLHDKKKENKRQLKLAIENNRKKIEELDKQYSLKQSLGLPAELKGSVEVDAEHSRQVEQLSNELNKVFILHLIILIFSLFLQRKSSASTLDPALIFPIA